MRASGKFWEFKEVGVESYLSMIIVVPYVGVFIKKEKAVPLEDI